MLPQNNEIYRHFKGNLYKIITLAVHSETEEQMVVYQGLYGDFPVYCRPLSMFLSEVDHAKYPEVSQKLRFERVDALVSADICVRTAETVDDNDTTHVTTNKLTSVSVDAELYSQADYQSDMSDNEAVDENQEDISAVDPLILEFLDADTIIEKKNILAALHHRITDDMINTLAVVMDVVIEEGELEDRYQQLKTCLDTIERYEIERK